MRINELVLHRYGHFADFTLSFPKPAEGEADFHLIYGPNEAGKSTTVSAIVDLMLGFARQTRAAHRFDNQSLHLEAELVDLDGEAIRLHRYKNALKDHQGHNLELLGDAGRFPALLSNLDQEDYRRRYSIDEAVLRAGSEDILASQGDVGHALFAASSGLHDLEQRIARAMESADRFYTPTARKLRFKELIQEHRDTDKELKALTLNAKGYQDKLFAEQEAADAVAAIQQELAELAQAKDSNQKRQEARELIPQLDKLNETIHSLESLGRVPREVIAEHPELADANGLHGKRLEIEEALLSHRQITTRLEDLESRHKQQLAQRERLDAHINDNRLLDQATRIGQLQHDDSVLGERYRQSTADQQECQVLDDSILALSKDLGLDQDALETLPGQSQLDQWQQVLEQRQQLIAKRDGLAADCEELELQLVAAGFLPPGSDPVEHFGAAAGAHDAQASDQGEAVELDSNVAILQKTLGSMETRRADAALTDIEQQLQAHEKQHRELQQHYGLPADADSTDLDGNLQGVFNRLEQLSQQVEHGRQNIIEHLKVADALNAASDTDTDHKGDAELLHARDRRKHLWQELHARLQHDINFDDARTVGGLAILAERVDRAMSDEDRAEQHARLSIDALARLKLQQQRRAELLEVQTTLSEQTRSLLQELTTAHKTLSSDAPLVTALLIHQSPEWASLNSSPELTADLFGARDQLERWCATLAPARRQALKENVDRWQNSTATLHALEKQQQVAQAAVDAEIEQLADLLSSFEGALPQHALRAQTLPQLQAEATRLTSALLEARDNSIKRAQKRVSDIALWRQKHHRLQQSEQRLAQWQAQWQEAAAGTVVAKVTAKNDNSLIQKLSRLAQQHDKRSALRQRIVAAQAMQAQHETALGSALTEFAADGLNALGDQLSEARQRQAKKRETLENLQGIEADIDSLKADLAPLARLLDSWQATLKPARLDDLPRYFEHSERWLEKQAERDDRRRALLRLLAVDENRLDDEIDTLRDEPVEALQARLAALQSDIDAQETAREAAIETLQRRKLQLEQLLEDQRHVELASRRENLLLELADGTKDTLRARIGHHLLMHTINSYRQGVQSEFLSEAERLFVHMTCGEYRKLQTQPDGKGGDVLTAIDSRGEARSAAVMSEGTRMQLYLALRMTAYLQQARKQSQPPFFADDVLEKSDDNRTRASLQAFGEMALTGQVIYLTHHREVVHQARQELGEKLSIIEYPARP